MKNLRLIGKCPECGKPMEHRPQKYRTQGRTYNVLVNVHPCILRLCEEAVGITNKTISKLCRGTEGSQ